jgi:hypothetical protein
MADEYLLQAGKAVLVASWGFGLLGSCEEKYQEAANLYSDAANAFKEDGKGMRSRSRILPWAIIKIFDSLKTSGSDINFMYRIRGGRGLCEGGRYSHQ